MNTFVCKNVGCVWKYCSETNLNETYGRAHNMRVERDVFVFDVLKSNPIHGLFSPLREKVCDMWVKRKLLRKMNKGLTWIEVNGSQHFVFLYIFNNFIAMKILHFLVIPEKSSTKIVYFWKKIFTAFAVFFIPFYTFLWNSVIFLAPLSVCFFPYLRLQELHFPQACQS